MMKILFLLTFPRKAPSARFRIYQYIPYLINKNIKIDINTIFTTYFYDIKNKKGIKWLIIKICLLIFFLIKRIFIILKIKNYDIIFIQREAFPFFTPLFEKLIRKYANKIIYDFDDAIYTSPTKWKNWRDYLRNPNNVGKVCELADVVIVGNKNLYNYAIQYNKNSFIVPTTYQIHKIPVKEKIKTLTIGWIGSWTTLINLNIIKNVIKELAKNHNFNFKIIGAENIYEFIINSVNIEYVLWKEENEIKDISSFDIGIMPLYNTVWEQGKCGFKIIQYMSLGIPVVASPVGVNKDIINHGCNGYIAETESNWFNCLDEIITNTNLRESMGKEASKTIKNNFSFDNNCEKLYEIIKICYE